MPLDGSELAEKAIGYALPLIQPFTASVTLLRVLTPAEFRSQDAFSRVDWRLQRRQAESYLQSVAQVLESAGIPCESRVEEGRPAEVILETARRLGTQLLVITSHGRGGATDFYRGGEVSKTLSAFGASVLLIDGRQQTGPQTEVRYQHLFVPVDGSHRCETAFRVAVILAESLRAQLTVAFVVERPRLPDIIQRDKRAVALCHDLATLARIAAERRLAQIRAQVAERITLHAEVVMARSADDTISELLQRSGADLIIANKNRVNGKASKTDSGISPSHVPKLLLNSESAGQAFQDLRPESAHDESNADVS